ncbi:MAG: T9SS type A sorting domain-containing protein [Bacteroidota bacterium]
MKKSLLLIAAITVSFCAQAQDVLLAEDSSTLTIGNFGFVNVGAGTGDPSGDAPGQGGWVPFCTAAAPDTDFQIIDMGPGYGNAFQLTSSAATTGNRRLYQDFSSAWSTRNPANHITEFTTDLYTGAKIAGSEANSRSYIYDNAKGGIYGGFYFDKTSAEASYSNYTLNGIIRLTTTPAGSINFIRLGVDNTDPANPVAADLVLEENTWYTIGVSIDYAVDKVIFKVTKKSDGTVLANTFIDDTVNFGDATTPAYIVTKNIDLGFAELTAHAAAGNAVADKFVYDNIQYRATPTEDLLSTKQNTLPESKFAVSPNPANNVIKITNTENINVTAIAVSDLNGRVVKQQSFNDASNIQVNVSDLSTGMYLMKITSDKGVATKKIIKN